MNNIYDDKRVVINDLQSYQQKYLLIFANGKYIYSSADKNLIEKKVKELIQIWNKVEVFTYKKLKCSYKFAIQSLRPPLSDVRCIYKFTKEHNRAYELPYYVWELVKEYAGIYNIGCMWNKGHIPIQHWKFSFMYRMLQDRFKCSQKQGKTYNVKKVYKLIKEDFKVDKNVMTCLHQFITQTQYGYDNDYSSYLNPNDYVLIIDKDWRSDFDRQLFGCKNFTLTKSKNEYSSQNKLNFTIQKVEKVNQKSFWIYDKVYSVFKNLVDIFDNEEILCIVGEKCDYDNSYSKYNIYYYLDLIETGKKCIKNVLAFPLKNDKFNLPIIDDVIKNNKYCDYWRGSWKDDREPPKVKLDFIGTTHKELIRREIYIDEIRPETYEAVRRFEENNPEKCFYRI